MSRQAVQAPVIVRILSDPACLCVVRSAAERYCLLAGFDSAAAQSVGLALDEALANVIKHGYGGRGGQPIHVELGVLPASDGAAGQAGPEPLDLRIRIRDFGKQIRPDQIASRDLDDVRPGGLGVHIIRSVMDCVEYRTRGQTGMELRMRKRLPGGDLIAAERSAAQGAAERKRDA